MGNKVFEMENAAGVAELVVLAELAPPISPADGLSISTIENLAPEVKQGFGAEAFSFALGLYVPTCLSARRRARSCSPPCTACTRCATSSSARGPLTDGAPRSHALAASQWQGPCARARAR